MFNKPDPERIRLVGPDRACAEWVLRNGGKVVWVSGETLADYNMLPSDDHKVPNWQDSLTHVQISKCPDVSDTGLKDLTALHKLETLVLFDLTNVNNMDDCKQYLSSQLPKCKIQGK
ncbi:hypothetical protein MSG28_009701 [Choristoneura fumiferana]|uniref:Uncharacterized protein n=1 Tax=Choristoneura fumiferana TaxID=7141 RepID=A0ACC0JCD6_CHOFU|nr:hypothetical protein MSG28_009701 [Choristoneura fumiferana]